MIEHENIKKKDFRIKVDKSKTNYLQNFSSTTFNTYPVLFYFFCLINLRL